MKRKSYKKENYGTIENYNNIKSQLPPPLKAILRYQASNPPPLPNRSSKVIT